MYFLNVLRGDSKRVSEEARRLPRASQSSEETSGVNSEVMESSSSIGSADHALHRTSSAGVSLSSEPIKVAVGEAISRAPIAAEGQQGYYNAARTLIILDWDDTLFPTNYLRSQSLLGPRLDEMLSFTTEQIRADPIMLPYHFRAHIAACETRAVQMMHSLLQYGNLAIVTNSTKEWIPTTACNFFPVFWDFIHTHNINFMSARPDEFTGENMHRAQEACTTHWKVPCFRQLILAKGVGYYTQVMSIGDGYSESRALMEMKTDPLVNGGNVQVQRNLVCKAVKYSVLPSPSRLLEQHSIVMECARRWFVHTAGDHADGRVSGELVLMSQGGHHRYKVQGLPGLAERLPGRSGQDQRTHNSYIVTRNGRLENGY